MDNNKGGSTSSERGEEDEVVTSRALNAAGR